MSFGLYRSQLVLVNSLFSYLFRQADQNTSGSPNATKPMFLMGRAIYE
jgi:hypothetical protein